MTREIENSSQTGSSADRERKRGTGAAGGYYSAILSFLLPGAGQLFGGRTRAALVFFVLFAVCLWSPSTVGISFLVALVAGVECLSRERAMANFRLSRRYVFYLTVSFLAFVGWFFAVGSVFIFGGRAQAADVAEVEPVNTDLVDLKKVDFTIHVDMVFAGEFNVSGKKLLPENRCILRKPVALAVARAQASLKLRQFSLKVFDCYHPTSLETKFKEWMPKTTRASAFVVDENPLYRGAALDAVLVQADGMPLTLPDAYEWASHDWAGKAKGKRGRAFTAAISKKAAQNVKTLLDAMRREGFISDPKRWWSFRYNNWERFSSSDLPFSEIP